ncbi:MAG: hypothetical protein IJN86_03620 [Clostridia bacterium]|nr:hypothetical protein [Clostridia bacterium]
MKNEGALAKLGKIKGIGYIAIALAAGLVLLLMGGGEEETVSTDRTALYVEEQRKSLEALGEEICGVDCKAAVYISEGFGYSYAEDQNLKISYNADGTVAEKEISLTKRTVNTKDGTALTAVKESTPKIKGVAVVCDGADDSSTASLKRLITALYSLEEGAVFVTN